MEKLFFDSWNSILRTIVIGFLAYVSLVLLLRVTGKRTLSKMNSFDLLVTIALGSTFATVLLNKSITLADGMAGFAILIFLQFILTWLSVRSKTIEKIVKSEPSLLYYKGSFLESMMKSERITKEEILSAIRESGVGSEEEVDAIVLETNGSISIIPKLKSDHAKILRNIKKPPHS